MLIWFGGMSVVFVWLVFRSPAIDYRLVMLGAVLPVGEVALGGFRPLHTLVASVAVLFVVMIATRQRRLVRRRWIGLPIGLMMHLGFDGVWTQANTFLWPFFGASFGPGGVPELERSLAVNIILELIGAAALAWFWRTFELQKPANRGLFLHTGHLPRELAG